MALKIRFACRQGKLGPLLLRRGGLSLIARRSSLAPAIFGYYYVKYQRIVDDRLKQPIFANTAKIYAAPREVRPGQKLTVRLIAQRTPPGGLHH